MPPGPSGTLRPFCRLPLGRACQLRLVTPPPRGPGSAGIETAAVRPAGWAPTGAGPEVAPAEHTRGQRTS
jgi:hypothetical protein